MAKSNLVIPETVQTSSVPKIKAVHPFGSKVLAEMLKKDEMLGTNLYIDEKTKVDTAGQAFIVELGPEIKPESGLKVGQRIYWDGKGCPVDDPRVTKGRIRALLEIHNIKAIIEEE